MSWALHSVLCLTCTILLLLFGFLVWEEPVRGVVDVLGHHFLWEDVLQGLYAVAVDCAPDSVGSVWRTGLAIRVHPEIVIVNQGDERYESLF